MELGLSADLTESMQLGIQQQFARCLRASRPVGSSALPRTAAPTPAHDGSGPRPHTRTGARFELRVASTGVIGTGMARLKRNLHGRATAMLRFASQAGWRSAAAGARAVGARPARHGEDPREFEAPVCGGSRTMRCASTGPIPGSASSSSAVARLRIDWRAARRRPAAGARLAAGATSAGAVTASAGAAAISAPMRCATQASCPAPSSSRITSTEAPRRSGRGQPTPASLHPAGAGTLEGRRERRSQL
jgi:hypothetical protein